jgi:hypothetical protein
VSDVQLQLRSWRPNFVYFCAGFGEGAESPEDATVGRLYFRSGSADSEQPSLASASCVLLLHDMAAKYVQVDLDGAAEGPTFLPTSEYGAAYTRLSVPL